MKPEPYKGVFGNMEFPEYKYQEYPKMLLDKSGKPHLDDAGQPLIVNSMHEELRAADGRVLQPTQQKLESDIENLKKELAAKDAQLAAAAKPQAKPPGKAPELV